MDGRPACGAQVVARRVSRSGRIATDQKAVRRRGPGRVVLGSKPQLATTEKLVRWAVRATGQKTRALGYTAHDCPNHLLFLFCLRAARAYNRRAAMEDSLHTASAPR